MRPLFVILALWLLPGLGRAQVIVNQSALQQLAGVAPAPAVVAKPVVKKVVRHWRVVRRPVVARLAAVVKPLPLPPPEPVPAVAPSAPVVAVPVMAAPVLPKLFALTVPSKPKVATAVVKPQAPPKAVAGAVMLRFAAGDDSLPAGAAAALQPICQQAAMAGLVVIDAYAPAQGDDPSGAMRESLTRAFAVKDALTSCGVPATKIIPRADGATGSDTAAARITLAGGGVEN